MSSGNTLSRDPSSGTTPGESSSVVERGEQGRVASAPAGGPVGLGEQEAGLLDGQVIDVRAGLFLGGDGEDVLVAGHPGWILGVHPRAERADRGQALVARRRAVVPADLEPFEESCDGGGVDAIEGELAWRG